MLQKPELFHAVPCHSRSGQRLAGLTDLGHPASLTSNVTPAGSPTPLESRHDLPGEKHALRRHSSLERDDSSLERDDSSLERDGGSLER